MEEVDVEWYGPYKIDTVVEEFSEYEDFGLYMITRKWGDFPDKILWIGMTYKQDFSTRLDQHRWLDNEIGTLKVRVGYLVEKRPSEKRLRHVENLLICVYQPKYNDKGKSTYSGRNLKIINSGRRGPLDKEVDSSDYIEW